jgi:hypothetical protein
MKSLPPTLQSLSCRWMESSFDTGDLPKSLRKLYLCMNERIRSCDLSQTEQWPISLTKLTLRIDCTLDADMSNFSLPSNLNSLTIAHAGHCASSSKYFVIHHLPPSLTKLATSPVHLSDNIILPLSLTYLYLCPGGSCLVKNLPIGLNDQIATLPNLLTFYSGDSSNVRWNSGLTSYQGPMNTIGYPSSSLRTLQSDSSYVGFRCPSHLHTLRMTCLKSVPEERSLPSTLEILEMTFYSYNRPDLDQYVFPRQLRRLSIYNANATEAIISNLPTSNLTTLIFQGMFISPSAMCYLPNYLQSVSLTLETAWCTSEWVKCIPVNWVRATLWVVKNGQVVYNNLPRLRRQFPKKTHDSSFAENDVFPWWCTIQ